MFLLTTSHEPVLLIETSRQAPKLPIINGQLKMARENSGRSRGAYVLVIAFVGSGKD
jgi:hypothetical protein